MYFLLRRSHFSDKVLPVVINWVIPAQRHYGGLWIMDGNIQMGNWEALFEAYHRTLVENTKLRQVLHMFKEVDRDRSLQALNSRRRRIAQADRQPRDARTGRFLPGEV